MTCCTFVYSVINLTWNKQHVFLILKCPAFSSQPRQTTEKRLEWRRPQKCFHIWYYYVGSLWAHSWFWHIAKKQFFDTIWCFFTIKTRFWQYCIVKYEKITLSWTVFSVVGAHNQQVFCMFKWGKKIIQKQQSVRVLVLSLWGKLI
jgi:hypothetical protein